MNRRTHKFVHSLVTGTLLARAATITTLLFAGAGCATAQTNFTLTDSTVMYQASDPNDTWQGVTTLESLELTPTADGLVVSAIVEPGSFNSGNFIRDGNARFSLFDTNRFPTATLSGTLPLAPEMLQAGTVSRTQETVLRGELLLHGVERALTAPVTVTREGSQLRAQTSFPVTLSAFGMERPSLFGVVVDDQVTVSVSLAGNVTAP